MLSGGMARVRIRNHFASQAGFGLLTVLLVTSVILASPAEEATEPIRVTDPLNPEDLWASGTDWQGVQYESLLMLTFQHTWRLNQGKTRAHLGGPFFGDYAKSVKGLGGWSDGDNVFTNYVLHPMQGATSGFVYLQNSSSADALEFGFNREYWMSRVRALGFAALYSIQFELGPYSEASIGNVGKIPGTMGWVDLIITPLGGLTWIVAEDMLDRFVVRPFEKKSRSPVKIGLIRVLLNPARSLANLLRLRAPWHRRQGGLDRRAEKPGEFEPEPASHVVAGVEPPRERPALNTPQDSSQ